MNWRRAILIGLIISFGAIVASRFVDAAELVDTLRRGQASWVMVALILQLVWLLNQTVLYQSLYKLVRLPATVGHLLPMVVASNFINFAAPSACLGGIALFLDDARQRGLDSGRVMLVNMLFMAFNLTFFVLLLVFGLIMLSIWHDLKLYQILTAGILLFNFSLLMGSLTIAGVRPKLLVRLLIFSTRLVNRLGRPLLRRDIFSDKRAILFANEFSRAAATLHQGRRLARPLFHALLVTLLDMSVLYACLVAFPAGGQPISLPMLVAGYSVGVLFMCVSITPQGLGVAEGVMAAAFVSLGIPAGRATVAVLAYRGLSFWLPMLTGFIALRWVRGLGRPMLEE